MPPNVWDNFLFDLASDLSFGFVTDAKTALLAAVLLGFLLMGLDMLWELLQGMAGSSAFKKAGKYFNLMRSDENLYGKDSPEYDYHSRIYAAHMNSAVKSSIGSGKASFEPDIISTDSDIAGNSDFVSESGFDGLETKSSFSSSRSDSTSFHESGQESTFSGSPGPSDEDRPGWL